MSSTNCLDENIQTRLAMSAKTHDKKQHKVTIMSLNIIVFDSITLFPGVFVIWLFSLSVQFGDGEMIHKCKQQSEEEI